MKKLLGLIAIAAVSINCAAFQLTLPLGGTSSGPTTKRTRPTSKTLNGTVVDKSDRPISGAVVYLKNMKTLAVKSLPKSFELTLEGVKTVSAVLAPLRARSLC